MAVKLDDERRAVLVSRLQDFYLQEFDEDLSAFRAEQVLNFPQRTGPSGLQPGGSGRARIHASRAG